MDYLIGVEISGKQVFLNDPELRECVLFAGKNSENAAYWLALECIKKGKKVIIVDLSGVGTKTISGYVRTVDVVSFIPDILKLPYGDQRYVSCISSLLSNVLSLPKNQRLILYSSIMLIARESGYVTPSSIFDTIDLVDGFRATEKEEVEGKVASFGQVEIYSGEASVERVIQESCLISFSSLKNMHLENFISSLLLSRLAISAHEGHNAVIFLTGGERVFDFFSEGRDTTFERYFLSGNYGKVITTFLEKVDGIFGTMVRERCHEPIPEGTLIVEKKGAMVSSPFYFITPDVREREPERILGEVKEERNISYSILDAISSSSSATRESIVSWLSGEYQRERVIQELDRLISERLVILTKIDEKSRILTLRLTELGKKELERMKEDGED